MTLALELLRVMKILDFGSFEVAVAEQFVVLVISLGQLAGFESEP